MITPCNNAQSSPIGIILWAPILSIKSQIQQVATVQSNKQECFCFFYFLVFQTKFEHFSSGLTDAVRRNQNASKRTGHGGCLHGPSHHGSETQRSSHGLRRRRRKTSATANLQQPHFVTPKVRTAAVDGDHWGVGGGRRGQCQSVLDRAPCDTKRRCCITVGPVSDERPCNEFISQITVFRL